MKFLGLGISHIIENDTVNQKKLSGMKSRYDKLGYGAWGIGGFVDNKIYLDYNKKDKWGDITFDAGHQMEFS